MDVFTEISLIIFIVAAVSFVMKLLKQPFVVGYILTGILVGPYVLNILSSKDQIEFFSKLGITILLFIVGLGLNPKVLREVGKISVVTGVFQVIFTTFFGYLICLALGLNSTSSVYVSVALSFSSTIIILKLLTDKGDVETLYGKISIGFLLVQDFLAIILLIAVSSIVTSEGGNLSAVLGSLILKGLSLTLILMFISKKILPKILEFVASSQELLFLFSIAWGMALASIFYELGFSIEVGALVAGVILSSTPYASEIASRMKPMRDFFILLFFVLLGSQMILSTISSILMPSILLSIFVLVGNPLIVFVLMNLLGYRRKTGFMAGLTVAQISEFSLILANLGKSVGHLSDEILSLITLVGLFTIGGSAYLILYSETIYKFSEKFLRFLEFRKVSKEKSSLVSKQADIILFGYDRAGSDFVKAINKLNKSFLVVDYNPEAIKRLAEMKIPYAYGDADDVEFLEEVGIQNAKLIVSTIPSGETNKMIVDRLSRVNHKALSIIISHHIAEAMELYKLGASYVVMPVYLGAKYAASMISRFGIDAESYNQERDRHLKHLSKRL